jgi:hypothetical protein
VLERAVLEKAVLEKAVLEGVSACLPDGRVPGTA